MIKDVCIGPVLHLVCWLTVLIELAVRWTGQGRISDLTTRQQTTRLLVGMASISAKHHTFACVARCSRLRRQTTPPLHSLNQPSHHACIGVGINNQSLLTLAILNGSIPAFARVLFALSQKAREYLRFSSTHHGFPTTPRWDTCASIRRAYFDRRNAPI